MSYARLALVAGTLAAAAFAAPAHADPSVCTAQIAGWAACYDAPACLYGGSAYGTFQTATC